VKKPQRIVIDIAKIGETTKDKEGNKREKCVSTVELKT